MSDRSVEIRIETGLTIGRAGVTFDIWDRRNSHKLGRMIVSAAGIRVLPYKRRRLPLQPWKSVFGVTRPARPPAQELRPTRQREARQAVIAKNTKRPGRSRANWTSNEMDRYRAAIAAGEETYASIARRRGVTAQTVWAQLNRDKLKSRHRPARASIATRRFAPPAV